MNTPASLRRASSRLAEGGKSAKQGKDIEARASRGPPRGKPAKEDKAIEDKGKGTAEEGRDTYREEDSHIDEGEEARGGVGNGRSQRGSGRKRSSASITSVVRTAGYVSFPREHAGMCACYDAHVVGESQLTCRHGARSVLRPRKSTKAACKTIIDPSYTPPGCIGRLQCAGFVSSVLVSSVPGGATRCLCVQHARPAPRISAARW